MNAQIVSIGNEVTGGAIADTNAAWLAQRLEELGATVTRHVAVRDVLPEIVEALEKASSSADVVIVTGGLGPTPDDLTRQAACDLTGRRLVPDARAEEMLAEFFRRRGRTPHPSNLKQASLPEDAALLANPRGTAAGFSVEHNGARLFFMPGVPAEMKGMFADQVVPRLREGASGPVAFCRLISLFGVPESEVGAALADLMKPGANPEVGTMAKAGLIVVRILARASGAQAARSLADEAAAQVRERFGAHVVSVEGDSLAQAVAKLLLEGGTTIALAESCTGGMLAGMLTDVPGISKSFLEGVVAYSNAAKIGRLGVPARLIEAHGAVSREVAEAMATGIRGLSGADIGVSVTGIAGPGGTIPAAADRRAKPVGLVHLALADRKGIISREVRFSGDRTQVRTRAAMTALDMIRRRLLDES